MRSISIWILIPIILVAKSINARATVQSRKFDGQIQYGVYQEGRSRVLSSLCERKSNRCQGQTPEYARTRRRIEWILINDLRYRQPTMSYRIALGKAKAHLQKIQDLKAKLYTKTGLFRVEPADDGLWEGDIILTERQIDAISKKMDAPYTFFSFPSEFLPPGASAAGPPAYDIRPNNRQKSEIDQYRSAAVFFEAYPEVKWKMPISYWVSPLFTMAEQKTIDDAIRTLEAGSGCIKFQRNNTRLREGSQIHIIKLADVGCFGYSFIGHVNINPVNIATTYWCKGNILKQLVMHELIHALGGGHEQSRRDRDYHIEILWENIDPQMWNQYQFYEFLTTSYGVKYDYRSIMHYPQGTFAVSSGLPTMRPKNDTELGGLVLTENDKLQLNRMYCRPPDCLDQNPDCGVWASFADYCNSDVYGKWMKKNCPRSCGVC